MSDGFNAAAFYDEFGIDLRLAEPIPEPPLSSAGEQAQAEVLHHLARMRASVEILESLVRDHPSSDEAFDAVDQTLAAATADACAALKRLRDRRDCKGAA